MTGEATICLPRWSAKTSPARVVASMNHHAGTFQREGVFSSAIQTEGAGRSKVRTSGQSCYASAEACDEVFKLVQRIFILPGAGNAPGAVAFCGVDQGAGCTWLSARVGETLAGQVSGSVCIVDANLRKPSLHAEFGVEIGTGFADLMKSSEPAYDFARRLPPMNLWLITAGAVGKEPNGALAAARLRARFAELRSEFDFVLIDTPALDSYADAVLLGQQTDGIILVVSSHSTRRETALVAKRNFEAAQIPMLGAVLNKRTYPIPGAIYRNI
jgi:Mrp family chromosome partitioning ATPase